MGYKNTASETLRVKKRSGNFVVIDKGFLENESLSLKAKGLLAYLLSKPDDWIATVGDVVNHCRDGRDAVYTGLKELEKAGYYSKRAIRDDNGRITRWEATIYEYPELRKEEDAENPHPDFPEVESPDPDFPDLAKPDTEKPDTEKPDTEKPEHTNNDITKKLKVLNNQSSLSAKSVKQADGQTDDEKVDVVTQYRAMLYGSVQYGSLYRNYKEDIELINKILDIALDAIVSECDYMMIDGQRKPHSVIKSTLLKLSYCNIVDVLQQFGTRTESIRKTKSYILSMLYNAVLEDGPRMINQYGCNSVAQ